MININNAEMKELTKVDGIGKVIALNIVNYRKRNNGFNELKELKNIKGIAEKTYKKLMARLTTSDKNSNFRKIKIEIKPQEFGIKNLDEMHLVGEMNNWNPNDKTYSLFEDENGIWTNKFSLKYGTEYKIMYDSTSWEEDKYIGDNEENFKVSY
ncbi:MAG: helix-hairpin-helix domain-containing protein [Halanaerobium sp.]